MTSMDERCQTSYITKDKPKYIFVYTLYRKSPLKEDNLSIIIQRTVTIGPEGVTVVKLHYNLAGSSIHDEL